MGRTEDYQYYTVFDMIFVVSHFPITVFIDYTIDGHKEKEFITYSMFEIYHK